MKLEQVCLGFRIIKNIAKSAEFELFEDLALHSSQFIEISCQIQFITHVEYMLDFCDNAWQMDDCIHRIL